MQLDEKSSRFNNLVGWFKNIFWTKQGTRNLDVSKQEKGIWDDLPQEILVRIFKKLHIVGDQVRFRAVRKDWRLPEDVIGVSDCLSESCLVTNRICAASIISYVRPFNYTLGDNCQELKVSSDSVRQLAIQREKWFEQITLHASKYGWLLFNTCDISEVNSHYIGLEGRLSLIFLHNPFTKEVIALPDLGSRFTCEAATFTMPPSCSECEVLVLCRPKDVEYALYVGRCCLYRDKVWSMTHLEDITQRDLSVCYMNGELYCLFGGGMLKSYNLIEESWKLVVESLPRPYASNAICGGNDNRYWLMEDEKKLMMVWRRPGEAIGEWLIFKMDWSNKRWNLERNLNVSIFINGNISLMAQLVDYKGNIKREGFVFYKDDDGLGCLIRCYSLQTERRFLQRSYEHVFWNNTVSFCMVYPQAG